MGCLQSRQASSSQHANNSNSSAKVELKAVQKITIDLKSEASLSDVNVGHLIGIGRFGSVHKGTWMATTTVACKKVQTSEYGTNQEEFENEIAYIKVMNHPNVLTYFGIYRELDTIWLVTEFMQLGSLEALMKDQTSSFSNLELYSMAKQIASGLVYVQAQGIIHRDVALRSILASKSGNKVVVKLTNFGLAVVANPDGTYTAKKNRCMLKWTAPEGLKYEGKFCYKSDVWSFGVMLWELFNGDGQGPYSNIVQSQLPEKLLNGTRLTCPSNCPKDFFDKVMSPCWNLDPEKRPSFTDLYSLLESYGTS